ncbi:MAG: hypothetical protein QGH82_05965 [Candidatus Woesearchaeota archaeon]|nr:hypothetical protein [Candidatus Woesearchaeota archaeon]
MDPHFRWLISRASMVMLVILILVCSLYWVNFFSPVQPMLATGKTTLTTWLGTCPT